MVIGNLDVEGMASLPFKANPVLIVNANTVLSRPASLQRLQPVRRGRPKVAKLFGAVDLDQPAKGNFGYLLKSPDSAPLKDRFCFPIAKRAYQTFIILRFALNVKQEASMKIMRRRDRRRRHDAGPDIGGFNRRHPSLVLQNPVHD